MSENIISILSALMIISTLASLIKWDDWWIRVFDFPRIQIATSIILLLFISFYFFDWNSVLRLVLVCLMVISLLYQGYKIYPYTVLANKQVRKYKGSNASRTISILVSNVLTPNRQANKLIDLVKKEQPQILLTLESDQWWEDQLKVLETEYPHMVKIPLDNLYGMHLYSKLEIVKYKVNFLVQEDIPSIEAWIKVTDDETIRMFCLHPKPPSPNESKTSTKRDAEILLVGKLVKQIKEPVLVLGDLNDVAWSNTTRLFQRSSGLVDPRVGRGFFSTFHATYPFLRWPLDHIFHSSAFEHITFKRLSNIGSDHFPIFTKLYLKEDSKYYKDKPVADREEKIEVTKKIAKADPIMEQIESSENESNIQDLSI